LRRHLSRALKLSMPFICACFLTPEIGCVYFVHDQPFSALPIALEFAQFAGHVVLDLGLQRGEQIRNMLERLATDGDKATLSTTPFPFRPVVLYPTGPQESLDKNPCR